MRIGNNNQVNFYPPVETAPQTSVFRDGGVKKQAPVVVQEQAAAGADIGDLFNAIGSWFTALMDKFTNKRGQLMNKIDDCHKALEACNETVYKLTGKVTVQEKEVKELTKKSKQLQEDFDALLLANNDAGAKAIGIEMEKASQKLADSKSVLSELRSNLNDQTAIKNQVESQITELTRKAEMALTKQELTEINNKTASLVKNIDSQLGAATNSISALTKEADAEYEASKARLQGAAGQYIEKEKAQSAVTDLRIQDAIEKRKQELGIKPSVPAAA